MSGTESRVMFSSRWRGREKTETNLSGGEGAMLLTVCWNALNSCLFNYANVHMQMTTVHNTMPSQLGDRLTRVGFRERPDYCPAILLQANSFWPVIIITRHQQGGLTRRLKATFCLRANACVGCTCGRLWTCYIYWFCSALLLLAAPPSRTNQLLRVQTYSRSAYVMCLFLSCWSSLYRSNWQLCEMWVKLHNIILSK